MEAYVILFWISLPAIILAALAGYLYGKKTVKKKIANEKANLQQMVEAGDDDKQEKENHSIQRYEMVTVLFADIVGFSEITDSLDPEVLLFKLNDFFLYFDRIIDSYQIEKIKTMGDAYMCAGGILHKNRTNPIDVVMMALEVQTHQKKMIENNPNLWSMRIGIHTGPVIAGVLGQKKLSFDIWGNTVNVAARLESSCQRGNINVSGTTYEKIKKYFDCEYNGKVPNTVEDVSSYIVKGLKPEFIQKIIDGQIVTNNAFFIQMQLLRLVEIEEYVARMMIKTSKLYFHNIEHILSVYEHVELLAYMENVEDENILLLKTAALMHDIGYAVTYEIDIRDVSENIARQSLPEFKYKPKQIDKICELIRATYFNSIPKGILEEIMHDANHIYFGQAAYNKLMMNLLHELKEHNIKIEKNDWLKNRCNRLICHRFYTQSAINLAKMYENQQITSDDITSMISLYKYPKLV